jgi:acetoin utilization deacetylase AcuC-like enzyme
MKVFYDDRQNVKNNKSISPSAGKPKLAVESWMEKFKVEIMPVDPVTLEQLCLIHDPDYVNGILNCEIENGFENKSKEIADSLLWTNGSFVSAAKHAAINKTWAASPTSGFHHATYDKSMGFCTFNGLVLAAVLLNKDKLANKIGILDLDIHYGNGTDDIINKLNIDYISHFTIGKNYRNVMGKDFLIKLPDIINEIIDKGVEILFYQAGADPHEDDPYGGNFSTKQLKERDDIVFSIAKEKGIPIVWNLAGGYQSNIDKVLEIHDNTALSHIFYE